MLILYIYISNLLQKVYEQQPETHPAYAKEWQNFWEKRYKELQDQGKDPTTYSYKDEWVYVWHKRMKELGDESLKWKKQLLMKKFNLTEKDLEYKSRSPVREKHGRSRNRSCSPWEVEEERYIHKNPSPPPPVSNSNISTINTTTSLTEMLDSVPTYSEPVIERKPLKPTEYSVIGTLKSLNELESQLGSFEPAINVLLENAISIMSKGNMPINLFKDQDNLVLLKLVKDKLISQITNKVLNPNATDKTEICIESISWLQKEAGVSKDVVKMPSPKKELYLGLDLDELARDTRGMDSNQVATHIAMCLLKNGKANATEKDLNEILTSVMKKSFQASRPQIYSNNAPVSQYSNTSHNLQPKSKTNPFRSNSTSAYQSIAENLIVSSQSNTPLLNANVYSSFSSKSDQSKAASSSSSSSSLKDKPFTSSHSRISRMFPSAPSNVKSVSSNNEPKQVAPQLNMSVVDSIRNLKTPKTNSYQYNDLDTRGKSHFQLSDYKSEAKSRFIEPKKSENDQRALFPSGISTSDQSSVSSKQLPSSSRESPIQTSTPPPNTPGALSILQDAYDDQTQEKKMENLSLDELHELLLNYKDIKLEEQQSLNAFLKKLEATDSQKVTKLRTMVHQSMKKRALNKKSFASDVKTTNEEVSNKNGSKSPSPDNTNVMKDSNERDDGSNVNNSNYDANLPNQKNNDKNQGPVDSPTLNRRSIRSESITTNDEYYDPNRPLSRDDDFRPFNQSDSNSNYTNEANRPYTPSDSTRPYTPNDSTRPYTPNDSTRPYTPNDSTRPYAPNENERPFNPREAYRPFDDRGMSHRSNEFGMPNRRFSEDEMNMPSRQYDSMNLNRPYNHGKYPEDRFRSYQGQDRQMPENMYDSRSYQGYGDFNRGEPFEHSDEFHRGDRCPEDNYSNRQHPRPVSPYKVNYVHSNRW